MPKGFARGDIFLAYLTGKSRYVGIPEVVSDLFLDGDTRVRASDVFPVRFRTKLVVKVNEDEGVHLHEVTEQSEHARSWLGYFRGSPQRLPEEDGQFIARCLGEIAGTSESSIHLSVGEEEPEAEETEGAIAPDPEEREHGRVRYRLLKLGQELGFDVSVARNDQSRVVDGQRSGDMSLRELPIFGFDDTTRRTVELIDVLWIDGNRIEAAFEIEKSTRIWSGRRTLARPRCSRGRARPWSPRPPRPSSTALSSARGRPFGMGRCPAKPPSPLKVRYGEEVSRSWAGRRFSAHDRVARACDERISGLTRADPTG